MNGVNKLRVLSVSMEKSVVLGEIIWNIVFSTGNVFQKKGLSSEVHCIPLVSFFTGIFRISLYHLLHHTIVSKYSCKV